MTEAYAISYSEADDWFRVDITDAPAGIFYRLILAEYLDAAAVDDPAILVQFTTDTAGDAFATRGLGDSGYGIGRHFVVLLQRGDISAHGYMQTVAWRRFVYGDQTASDENMTYTVSAFGGEIEPGDPLLTGGIEYVWGDEADPPQGDGDEVAIFIQMGAVFDFGAAPGHYVFTVYDAVHGPGPTAEDDGDGGPMILHTHAVDHGTSDVRHPSPGSVILLGLTSPDDHMAFAGIHLFASRVAHLWGRV